MENQAFVILVFAPSVGKEQEDTPAKQMLRWLAQRECEMVVKQDTAEMCVKLLLSDERLGMLLERFTKPEVDGTYLIEKLTDTEGVMVLEFKG